MAKRWQPTAAGLPAFICGPIRTFGDDTGWEGALARATCILRPDQYDDPVRAGNLVSLYGAMQKRHGEALRSHPCRYPGAFQWRA